MFVNVALGSERFLFCLLCAIIRDDTSPKTSVHKSVHPVGNFCLNILVRHSVLWTTLAVPKSGCLYFLCTYSFKWSLDDRIVLLTDPTGRGSEENCVINGCCAGTSRTDDSYCMINGS